MKTNNLTHRHLKRQLAFFIFMMLLISVTLFQRVSAQASQASVEPTCSLVAQA